MATTQTTDVLWDQSAYEQLAYFALRSTTFYDQFCTIKPTNQSMPGASVIFDFVNELTPATTALTEATDITPATMGDTQVTVTLAELGNGVQTTARLKGVSFLPVDPLMANIIGWNMADSVDLRILAEIMNGTNLRYSGGVASRVTIAAGSTIVANDIRFCVAKLRAGNAMTFDGITFTGSIHPDVSYDLRIASGSTTWRDAQLYTDANIGKVWNAYVGLLAWTNLHEVSKTKSLNHLDLYWRYLRI